MKRLVLVLFVATALQSGVLYAAEPVRILFVGNSYTYFNDMPEIFGALARAALPGRQVEVRMVAIPGETLVSLWERSDARRVLRSSTWDYVVLQDQSLLGEGLRDGKFVVNAPTLLHWGVRLFDEDIRQVKAHTVLLLTWARRAEPRQQGDLDFAYDSIARELEATLAPVGRVWQSARQENPDLELYAADGSHPSPVGSYLVACTLVAALIPEAGGMLPASVSGHPVDVAGHVDASQTVDLVALSTEQAMQLQTLARSLVSRIRRQGGYLNAPPPERRAASASTGGTLQPDRIGGAWAGDLIYYPSPAHLHVTFRFAGNECQGEAAIEVTESKQRYETPLAMCSVSGSSLSFAIDTLPMPYLTDRFTGQYVDGRLVGTVERTGRELTNIMSGTWSLHRQAAPGDGVQR